MRTITYKQARQVQVCCKLCGVIIMADSPLILAIRKEDHTEKYHASETWDTFVVVNN